MKRNLFLVMAILLVLSFALTGCGGSESSGSSEGSSEDDVFRVGLEAMYPPFNWTQLDDSNGGIKIAESNEYAGGYDVEIAKKVAKKLGKKLVIVKVEWDGLVPALQTNVIDAIMAGMSPTETRKKTIDFSDNYYQSTYVLVVKKGSKYENATSIQDFKGAKVTGQLNTTHYDVIDQIEGVDKQVAAVDFPAMRTALGAGAIDAYVTEIPEAISSTSANPDFVMVNPAEGFEADLADTAVAVGLRKGDKNIDLINEALAEISEEERNRIMKEAIKNQPAADE